MEIKSNKRKGLEEEYVRKDTEDVVVKIDPKFFRPAEVDFLLGDPTKAKKKLGWKPKITFKLLVKEMIDADAKELHKELWGCNGKKQNG